MTNNATSSHAQGMHRRILERSSWALMLISALGILVFTAMKAQRSSFTHDESVTWALYVHLPFSDLLAHKEAYTNNHMLNSILMKWSEAVFGNGELALRLPNLVALVIFLVYGALLVRPFGPVIGTLTYICLCYAGNVMELFGLARGYGLSYGFLMMTLFHAWRSLGTGRLLHVLLTHVGLVLAVLSSFVVLQFAVALMLVLPLVVLACTTETEGERRTFFRAVKAHAAMVPFTVIALWEPLRRVSKANRFEFGGSRGFIDDTFTSLTYSAFPAVPITEQDVRWVWYTFLVLFSVALAYIVVGRWRRKAEWSERLPVMLAWSVLPATMLVIVAQHGLLGTPYPEVRFGKFLFPLAMLHAGALSAGVARHHLFWPATALLVWGAFASVRTFFQRTTFHTSNEWQYDMDTDLIMQAIATDMSRQREDMATVSIGHPWILAPGINYYRLTRKMDRVRPAHRNGPAYNEDYLVLADSMLAGFDSSCYQNAGHFANAGWWMYRKVPVSD
jgi:hypothetical protein